MVKKKWRPLDWEECAHCGSAAEVFTECEKPGQVMDSDEVRCTECGCPGSVSVDDDGCWVNWHDEPGCTCDWCKAHPAEPLIVQGAATTEKPYTLEWVSRMTREFTISYKGEVLVRAGGLKEEIAQRIVDMVNDAYAKGFHACSVKLMNKKRGG